MKYCTQCLKSHDLPTTLNHRLGGTCELCLTQTTSTIFVRDIALKIVVRSFGREHYSVTWRGGKSPTEAISLAIEEAARRSGRFSPFNMQITLEAE